MIIPLRIQRRRTKGWRMPPNTVYVGRPTKFGNPFSPRMAEQAGFANGQYMAVWAFEEALKGNPDFTNHLHLGLDSLLAEILSLRGCNQACWCPLCRVHTEGKPFDVECGDCTPCHVDVLGALANQLEVRA